MIYDNIQFHNIAELREVEGYEGKRLQRVPEEVRLALSERGQQQMLKMAGAELRFISIGDVIKIKLSCPEENCELIPFWGLFQGNQRINIKGEKTIELKFPERLKNINLDKLKDMNICPQVWRLVLRGGPVFYHGIEGDNIVPPAKINLPKKRYLAYGTSITHGAGSTGIHLAYVSQAACILGVDLYNLGSGGSAFCEAELADYIVMRDDWDFASLSLSVNMVGGFSVDEFKNRVHYMVNKIANTNKPVFCITIFSHFRDICKNEDEKLVEKTHKFRKVLSDIVKESKKENLYLIKGEELLTDPTGLSVDLIHPADNGMIQMGGNLAQKIKQYINV